MTIIPLAWSRRAGMERGSFIVYVSMATWKNTGLCITTAIVLMPGMQGALLPRVLSFFAENFWFMIIVNRADKIWGYQAS